MVACKREVLRLLQSVTRCLGLVTQYNSLTAAPGALVKANDCVIRRENVIENRRGYKSYGDVTNNVENLFSYNNTVLAHNGTKLSYDNGSGTFNDYTGSYDNPSGVKARGIEAYQNFYLCTSLGVKVFTDTSGTAAKLAGAPRSLDPSYTLTSTMAGFLTNAYQCAYRALIKREDANKNIVFGYPSQRLWVVNATSDPEDVVLTIYIHSDVEAGDVFQMYRTEIVSGTSSDTAGDEMGLVFEYTVTSTDISNGYVSFTDSVTDDLRGATLYSSPSQEGISQANERPPLAEDIALYKSNFMFYANTQTKQRLTFTIVGISNLSGNSLVLAGTTYTFGASENTSTGAVEVFSTGATAADIDNTARSLVRVINRYSSNTSVYAYYLSGPDDLPGKIMIEERGVGASAFTAQCDNSGASTDFFPECPVSPATSTPMTSSNSIQTNGLYYSKFQQPEAVPILNYVPVGPANRKLLRIAPLRDSLIIITDGGVYRLTGENPQSFTVVPLDLTAICKAPESVRILANQVLMLSNQGIVSISENGVQVVSREIEPSLLPLLQDSTLNTKTYAISYESERSYIISTISSSGDSEANQTFVYNIFTRTWVRWTYAFEAAVVEESGDKLYFASPSSVAVNVERKSFTDDDYADKDLAITIVSIDDTTVVFTMASGSAEIGHSIKQGTTAIIISDLTFDGIQYTATLEETPPATWAAGAATLFPSVDFDIEWNSWSNAQPGALKQARSVAILTDDISNFNTVSSLKATFRTNYDPSIDQVTLLQPGRGWGDAWGDFPWGGGADTYGYPTFVPRNKQYFNRMNVGVKHTNALQRISLAGVTYEFEMISEEVGR